jgi:hypothetical protein
MVLKILDGGKRREYDMSLVREFVQLHGTDAKACVPYIFRTPQAGIIHHTTNR